MDADGYYSDITAIHLKVDDLTIFRSQYNIGRRVVETMQKAAVLDLNDNHQPDGKKKFQDINLLFLGPTYKTLRNQTKKDLGNFLQERINIPHSQIVKICESRVLNSSAVPDNYEDMPFIKILRQNPEHFLHILVFDEAHWGISSGSIIDRFFQYLAKLRKDIIKKEKFKPSLIILLVSATIDVFTRVIHRYANGALRVDWSALRLSDRKKFGTPQYLNINQLHLCNDTNPNLLRQTTMAQRSSFVVAEYSETIRTCLETVFRLQNKNWKNNATWEALKFLLPGNTNDEIADRVCAVDYAPGHNYIVLLRLQLNQHVTDLYNDILKTFRTISTKINNNIRPFELIQLIQDSDSILKQLSPKATRHLHLDDQIVEDDLVVSKLYNLPCLILVNDKLGMGERLPSSCMAFDVRSRYKGDAADMKGFACTFIQDIDRCCGQMKPRALVLMSITNKDYRGSGEIGQLTLEDVKFSQLNSLLTKTQSAAAAHPERHAKAFSELSSSVFAMEIQNRMYTYTLFWAAACTCTLCFRLESVPKCTK